MERRLFTRFMVRIPVTCEPVIRKRELRQKQLVCGVTRNISNNGALLEWPLRRKPTRFLRVNLRVLSKAEPLELIGKVIWCREKNFGEKTNRRRSSTWEIGVSFVGKSYKYSRLLSSDIDFYWQIFQRTGSITAYLLQSGIMREGDNVSDATEN